MFRATSALTKSVTSHWLKEILHMGAVYDLSHIINSCPDVAISAGYKQLSNNAGCESYEEPDLLEDCLLWRDSNSSKAFMFSTPEGKSLSSV